MKKTFIILLALLYVNPVLSAMVCAKDADSDTERVSLVMDPAIAGTGNDKDATNMVWYTKFPWGTISGTAGCFDVNGGSQGATNAGISDTTPAGKYCWCKMEHPAVSGWAFTHTYDSYSACVVHCAVYCDNNVRNSASMRGGLFGSVGK